MGMFSGIFGQSSPTPRPTNIAVSGPNAAAIDRTIKEKLHPAVYNFLAQRNVTVHEIPAFESNLEAIGLKGLYDPLRRQVWTTTDNPGIVIHELGHAVDFTLGSKIWENQTGNTLYSPLEKLNDNSPPSIKLIEDDAKKYGQITEMGKGSKVGANRYYRAASVDHQDLISEFRKSTDFIVALKNSGQEVQDGISEIQERWHKLMEKEPHNQAEHFDSMNNEIQQFMKKYQDLVESRTAPSEYGATNAFENFAESFRGFHGLGDASGKDRLAAIDRPLGGVFVDFMKKSQAALSIGSLPSYSLALEGVDRDRIGIDMSNGQLMAKMEPKVSQTVREHVPLVTPGEHINPNALKGFKPAMIAGAAAGVLGAGIVASQMLQSKTQGRRYRSGRSINQYGTFG